MINKLKTQKGFTIIELLFVILLIGILVWGTIIFLNNSRESARDAKRLVDVRRIQTALEFYNIEYGKYPLAEEPIELGTGTALQLCNEESGGIVGSIVSCQSQFIAPIPADPTSRGKYLYISDSLGYTLQFKTEADTRLGQKGIYYAHSELIDQDPTVK